VKTIATDLSGNEKQPLLVGVTATHLTTPRVRFPMPPPIVQNPRAEVMVVTPLRPIWTMKYPF